MSSVGALAAGSPAVAGNARAEDAAQHALTLRVCLVFLGLPACMPLVSLPQGREEQEVLLCSFALPFNPHRNEYRGSNPHLSPQQSRENLMILASKTLLQRPHGQSARGHRNAGRV